MASATTHARQSEAEPGAQPPARWLFSAPVDLAAFLGSAVLSLVLLGIGAWYGWLWQRTPEWTWITAVLLLDVAHVYATAFRVYFVPRELLRRPGLYLLTPLLALVIGAALYSESELLFWRVLAYLAVFHFVRQQYGWVALYRRRAGERDRLGAWVDGGAIYLATLYPLLYWHAHLPRNFAWFLNGDFVALPALLAQIAWPIYLLTLAAYAARSAYRGFVDGHWNPGKDVVVLTTALCWYIGIVAINSDYAFTVTNVVIHGVPYMVLVYWYNVRADNKANQEAVPRQRLSWGWRKAIGFLATLWLLAYAEELLWDRSVWQERPWLFCGGDYSTHSSWLAPLLAVPQITHYILDGFIWRRRSNPDLASREG